MDSQNQRVVDGKRLVVAIEKLALEQLRNKQFEQKSEFSETSVDEITRKVLENFIFKYINTNYGNKRISRTVPSHSARKETR